jgi:hypothetical protein
MKKPACVAGFVRDDDESFGKGKLAIRAVFICPWHNKSNTPIYLKPNNEQLNAYGDAKITPAR